jgi:hypothetical protein
VSTQKRRPLKILKWCHVELKRQKKANCGGGGPGSSGEAKRKDNGTFSGVS